MVRRRAPAYQATDRSMSVPVSADALATSWLTTTLAKGMARSSCQPFRMGVTRLREACRAMGACGAVVAGEGAVGQAPAAAADVSEPVITWGVSDSGQRNLRGRRSGPVQLIGLLGCKPGRAGPGGNPSACRWKGS